MKEKYNGLSEYQNKKRIDKQRENTIKDIESEFDILLNEPKKVIAIMLDIEGTINGINGEKIKEFVKILNSIKKKYDADIVKICISTHDPIEDRVIALSQLLKTHLKPEMIVDKCFYLDGIYDPIKGEIEEKEFHFNYQKLSVFEKYYLSYNYLYNENVVWFGIIDDSMDENHIYKYKNTHSMAIFKPSQMLQNEDNIMCHTTQTYGFDGVLELLKNYNSILFKLGPKKLFEEQQKILPPLNHYIFIEMVKNRDYSLMLRYINEVFLDEYWYVALDRYLKSISENDYNEVLIMIRNKVSKELNKGQPIVKKHKRKLHIITQ